MTYNVSMGTLNPTIPYYLKLSLFPVLILIDNEANTQYESHFRRCFNDAKHAIIL